MMSDWKQQIEEATASVRTQTDARPEIGIILGSGLGALGKGIKVAKTVGYETIKHFPRSTVESHAGRFLFGELGGKSVVAMQGRFHFYEGYTMQQITLPVRVMHKLGVKILIVSNACGGMNPQFVAGDIMAISDHINLLGGNPLIGPNLDDFGPRFPDMSRAYDRELCALARQVAKEHRLVLREGVYACLAGPSFETPADLRFLRSIGVDAVGMSTVPEVTVARHGGIRVLGISGISNKANLDGDTITTHEEVLLAGEKITPQLITLIRGVLKRL